VRIDPAGLPFAAIAAVPAAIAALFGWTLPTIVLLALPIAVALFFRDPERVSPSNGEYVLSPADGTVMHAGPARDAEAPPGQWRQVTIFLSPLDVHINRAPVAGRVTRVEYRPGSFLPAYRPESHGNERSEIWIDHDGTPIVVRQVVGVLARRVVCRVKEGDELGPGARIGLMKFGSRMDVFVPLSAEIKVRVGEKVRGGVSVIAILRSAPSR
jgi:phosphatidylserine decarboxylase